VTGFSIRPEMMKVIMYRNDRKDISFIPKVIKTVNFMNRMFFRSEEDYLLKIKGEKGGPFFEANFSSYPEKEDSRTELPFMPQQDSAPASVVQSLAELSESQNKLLEIMKRHHAMLVSKGNLSKFRYELRVQGDKSIEEMMSLKMPNVYEEISPEERDDISAKNSSGLRFFDYLQVLLELLEEKLKQLPSENMKLLSVRDLVFYGSGNDSSDSDSSKDSRQARKMEEKLKSKIEAKYRRKFD